MSFDPTRHPRTPADGRFTATARPEPDLALDQATTWCLACGATGIVNDGGHMIDEAGGLVCRLNEPDGHLAAGGPASVHPAQVHNLVRRVRRLQTTQDWADGRIDMRPLLAGATARLEQSGKAAGFLAGVRTIMASPAWQSGEVNVAALLADALDELVPPQTDEREDTAAFAHLLSASRLSGSGELSLATVRRQATAQRPGLVLPYTVFDGATRRHQHVVLVLDADRSVSTWCAGRQLDSYTWSQVWGRIVAGTEVGTKEAPALVAELLAGVDQR